MGDGVGTYIALEASYGFDRRGGDELRYAKCRRGDRGWQSVDGRGVVGHKCCRARDLACGV